jgi:quercetin dioxygenase-like cupin family protein
MMSRKNTGGNHGAAFVAARFRRGPLRRRLFVIVMALVMTATVRAQQVIVSPNGTRVTTVGAADTFTGAVLVEPLFSATAPARAAGARVTFAPGARSAWHTHPAGQTLIVTDGVGWVQEWSGPKREIKAGDVVWTPPGVKHWHGATRTTSMTHLAIQELVNDKVVNWQEHVTDEQYGS